MIDYPNPLSKTRRARRALPMGLAFMVLSILLPMVFVGPSSAQHEDPAPDSPAFEAEVFLYQKALDPDLRIGIEWSAQELAAVFIGLQKASDPEPSAVLASCGVVDEQAEPLLEESPDYAELVARGGELEGIPAELEVPSGQCLIRDVADIEGIADIEGVADIEGLWIRIDLLDIGGRLHSGFVSGKDLSIGTSVELDELAEIHSAAFWPEIDPGEESGSDQLLYESYVSTPEGERKVVYQVTRDGWALTEGDIVLGRADELAGIPVKRGTARIVSEAEPTRDHKSHTVPSAGFDWPGGTVRFEFGALLRAHPSFAAISARVMAAATAWNSTPTNISISPCAPGPGGFADCDANGTLPYLRISLSATNSCRSLVGWAPNPLWFQPMWIGPACSTGNIIHEFGHTLGLFHEHQRPDSNNLLEVITANASGAGGNLASHAGGVMVGAHDLGSIMHYPWWAFSSDQTGQVSLPTLLRRNRLSQWNAGTWTPVLNTSHTLDELAFGDFGAPGAPGSPDGIADTLTLNAPGWQVVFGGGGTSWETLANEFVAIRDLQFGELDGQPGTDVVAHFPDAEGDERWHVSDGGVADWRPLAKSSYGMDRVKVADFGQRGGGGADGRADVFGIGNGHFRVSWNGYTRWQELRPTDLDFDQVAFGDFGAAPLPWTRTPGPPDGITDVIARFDGRWQISFGGTSEWHPTRSSGIGPSRFLVADVGSEPPGNGNGTPGPADGQDDLVTTFSGRLWVSYGAQTSWRRLGSTNAHISLLKLGNRTGDAAAEVLSDGLFSAQRTAPSAGDIAGIAFVYP